ncbi:hypothetical protein Tco_1107965 [Tanacetum coccineum]
MAAPVISISLDVSVESVGSSFLRVILIGSISVEVPVTPKVGAAAVSSPAGVLELDTHSSSEVDPSESSPPPVSVAPMVLPFLCLDNSDYLSKFVEAEAFQLIDVQRAVILFSDCCHLINLVSLKALSSDRVMMYTPNNDIFFDEPLNGNGAYTRHVVIQDNILERSTREFSRKRPENKPKEPKSDEAIFPATSYAVCHLKVYGACVFLKKIYQSVEDLMAFIIFHGHLLCIRRKHMKNRDWKSKAWNQVPDI